MSETTSIRPCRCIGILGRLFGHKFKMNMGNHVYSLNYCSRCGMPAGLYIAEQTIEEELERLSREET